MICGAVFANVRSPELRPQRFREGLHAEPETAVFGCYSSVKGKAAIVALELGRLTPRKKDFVAPWTASPPGRVEVREAPHGSRFDQYRLRSKWGVGLPQCGLRPNGWVFCGSHPAAFGRAVLPVMTASSSGRAPRRAGDFGVCVALCQSFLARPLPLPDWVRRPTGTTAARESCFASRNFPALSST